MPNSPSPRCPVARTLDVIGARWAPLIMRDLLVHGARRFQDLHDSLEGIAPTTLSVRLKTLEQHGIIERRFYTQHPPRAEYILTKKGRDLGPVLRAMRNWGEKYGE
jgi:DNA-binding HxlR family transcriptional regulator